MPSSTTHLGFSDFHWADLHSPDGLARLFDRFCVELGQWNPTVATAYRSYMVHGATGAEESRLLIDVAPYVSRFVAQLFGVGESLEKAAAHDRSSDVIATFKKEFIQKRVLKRAANDGVPSRSDVEAICRVSLSPEHLVENESALATVVLEWLDQEKKAKAAGEPCDEVSAKLSTIEAWCADLYRHRDHVAWASFHIPEKVDFNRLVDLQSDGLRQSYSEDHWHRRDGFDLVDRRMTTHQAMGETHYCLLCHDRDKDSCNKGLRHNVTKEIQTNPLGIALTGCPLDEKISESHLLRRTTDAIAALSMVMIDNPMCPGTGHRICNDCMKACIFQKQDPVDVPQIETNTLTEVLALPFGFEIYSLLTRWNPLNRKRPYALPYNGKNVLVVGMGPAGYTLSHYLLNEGFGVVGIDGLKIEPFADEWVKPDANGTMLPIHDIEMIRRPLDERVISGFGGVAEYGITARWDKNFLTYIYLTLARRSNFRVFGGVRFGGTITIDEAWELGFDHIALATGAGKPTIVPMENNLIRGIRKASDFLMTLQLNGAYRRDSLANLQIELPAIVIGGGLTAIDTATEIMAYYPIQVEKTLERYETLVAEKGEAAVVEWLDSGDRETLKRFLTRGRDVRAERKRAKLAGEEPNFIPLIQQWGGVTIAYRRGLADSPAYRLNHEEVRLAMREGIYFAEGLSPKKAIEGKYGQLDGMEFERMAQDESGKWRATGEIVTLPARSCCVAAGTAPNTVYEKEYAGTFEFDPKSHYFRPYRIEENGMIHPAEPGEKAFLTSYFKNGHSVSFYGDNHPHYFGNVVKAMASAKHGYEQVTRLLSTLPEKKLGTFDAFSGRVADQLTAVIHTITRLTPTIVEIVVHAPLAARRFKPGQFYRFQNYEATAPRIDGVPMAFEGIALTGAWVDREKGLLGMIALELGASSRLCASLKPGEKVVVMGPTGTPTEIPTGETVCLVGGGLGNAVLFSIAKALKDNGNHVLYFAGYKDSADLFKQDDVEQSTDVVVWSNDKGAAITPRRPQDKSVTGNILEAMLAYAEGRLGEVTVPLSKADRLIVIGSDRMMNAIREARGTILKPHLKPDHHAIGSINSPMQCMLKQICAQCLQRHVDPQTGEEIFVFSCFNQDQPLDNVDFENLQSRLKTNRVQEVLTNQWLDRLLQQNDILQV